MRRIDKSHTALGHQFADGAATQQVFKLGQLSSGINAGNLTGIAVKINVDHFAIVIDRYLDVLIPLGIQKAERLPTLKTRASDDASLGRILSKAKADAGAPLVGLFPGAGHPSRRWPLQQFASLADFLIRNDQVKVLVFVGPEERSFVKDIRQQFPPSVVVLDQLTIPQLAAAQARLAAFVSNDTGPMHIASAVGTPVVLLLDKRAPESYLPQGDRHRVIYNSVISEITVDEVYVATRSILASGRTAALFAS